MLWECVIITPGALIIHTRAQTHAIQAASIMVHYELAVIFRTLGKPQLSTALRGACTALLEQGSIVRGMENRGERRLPYKMGAHKERFTHGR